MFRRITTSFLLSTWFIGCTVGEELHLHHKNGVSKNFNHRELVSADICTIDHDLVQSLSEVYLCLTVVPNLLAGGGTGVYDITLTQAPFNGLVTKGYCLDEERSISSGCYDFDTYSIVDTDIPADAFDKPDNLDLVTYLANYWAAGMQFDDGNGCDHTVTNIDMQVALWGLIDNSDGSADYLSNSEDCVVSGLVADATANGENYFPSCDDPNGILPLILVVDDQNGAITKQVTYSEISVDYVCTCEPGGGGDPHFKTWSGKKYDFHGACDLVLLQNPDFQEDLGIDINIRTKFTKQWSYISSAVIRIGSESLEVMGGNENRYWINKVEGKDLADGISGFPITFNQANSNSREFRIDLMDGSSIFLKTFKDFVRVDVDVWKKSIKFEKSFGLMGNKEGEKVGRDKETIFEDDVAFGLEWQVLASEPVLFHDSQGVQHPEQCLLPNVSSKSRRRLREATITMQDAEIACARVSEVDRDSCIFDVMATNDNDMAGAY